MEKFESELYVDNINPYFRKTGGYAEILAYLIEMNQNDMAAAILDNLTILQYKNGYIDALHKQIHQLEMLLGVNNGKV